MADTMPSPPLGTLPGGRPGAGPAGERQGDRNRGQPAAGDAIAAAMDFGTELLGAVRDSATALFDEQRNRAANEIGGFGEVLHGSVQALDQRGATAVARYTDDAARQISQFADRLRRRSLTGLSADLEDLARRWPLRFIASAIGVGLIAGRFLVSSVPRPATKNPAENTQFSPLRAALGGEETLGSTRADHGAVGGRVFGSTKPGSLAGSAGENG
jgi:hypothetical protein